MRIPERLLLLLFYLRTGLEAYHLAERFRVSEATVRRQLNWGIPILSAKIRLIHLFDEDFLKLCPQLIAGKLVSGAIDCSTHARNRVHPGQR